MTAGHQGAYDEISRGLDLPAKAATASATTAASVRRAMARQVQRALLKD
ncbi:hypothetical protein ACWGNF_25910 [Streptomyces sp. NPDC055808]